MLFPGEVIVYCEAEVAGEKLTAQEVVPDIVWEDPEARKAIEKAVRAKLMYAILEKWTPAIKTERR